MLAVDVDDVDPSSPLRESLLPPPAAAAPALPVAVSNVSFDDQSLPGSHSEHVPIRTLPAVVLHLVAIVADSVQVFTTALANDWRYPLSQIALFGVFLATFLFIRADHQRLRSRGYLSSFISMKHALWPLFVSAVGALAVMVVYHFVSDAPGWAISRATLLQLLVSVQNAMLLFWTVRYGYTALRHNVTRTPPEVLGADPEHSRADRDGRLGDVASINSPKSPASPPPKPSPSHSATFRKQTHMIVYLQDQCRVLSHEILRLKSQAEFQGLSGSVGGIHGRSDMDHLLSAKEQEMRAIAAERDRLRTECQKHSERYEQLKRTAQALSDERDKNAVRLTDLQNNLDSTTKKYQKLQLVVSVEQEARANAMATIQTLKAGNWSPQ